MDPDLVRQQEEEAQSYRRAHNGATRIATNGAGPHHRTPVEAAASPSSSRAPGEDDAVQHSGGPGPQGESPPEDCRYASISTIINSAMGGLIGAGVANALIAFLPWLEAYLQPLAVALTWAGGLLMAAIPLARRCGLRLREAVAVAWFVPPLLGTGVAAAVWAAYAKADGGIMTVALAAGAVLSAALLAWLVHHAMLSRLLRRRASNTA